MKRLMSSLFVFFSLASCPFLAADKIAVSREISALILEISTEYKQNREIVMKKNISVAGFQAEGSDAAKYRLGSLLKDLVSTEISRSTVFNLVERENIDKILKEQAFQMTGLADTDKAVQIGKILNADALLTGSVTETGDHFNITLRLMDVETGKVISKTASVPKEELIKTADDFLTMAYVKKSGIGISVYFLGSAMSGNNGVLNPTPASDQTALYHRVGVELKYRATKFLMFGTGIGMLWGPIQYYPRMKWGNLPTSLAAVAGLFGAEPFIVEAKGVGIPFNVYLNWNVTRRFSVFFNPGVELAMLDISGYFTGPLGGGLGFGKGQIGPSFYQEPLLINICGGFEFFITPRLALTVKAGYQIGSLTMDFSGVPYLPDLLAQKKTYDLSGFSFLPSISVYF